MYYQALREGLNSKAKMVVYGEPLPVLDTKRDYYVSLFQYTEEEKNTIEERGGSVAGLTGTTTDVLYWDFDDENDLDKARHDTVNFCQRLENAGVPKDAIEVYFSGKKGFNVKVSLTERITNQLFKQLTYTLASSLPTFDSVVNDPNRIVRVPNTKHPKSGLYKVPLEIWEVRELKIDEIQYTARKPRWATKTYKAIDLPTIKVTLPKEEVKVKVEERHVKGLDWTSKPRFLSNCRYALQNGYFGAGQRDESLLILAATYRNLGFDIEHTYRILKGVCSIQAKRNNTDRFSDEELYNNICTQVYGSAWNGGQGSCSEPHGSSMSMFLSQYCASLGDNACTHKESESGFIKITEVSDKLRNFAKNIDKNTILTGIPSLDEKMRMTIGQHVAILGAPSSGKSSLALQILENTSLAGVKSAFFSMDMSDLITGLKLSSRVSNKSSEQVIQIAKEDDQNMDDIDHVLADKYKNVNFCFRNGLNIENIREMIIQEQKKLNNELKLVVVDYASRISGPWSDMTANGAYIASGLRSIANELGVCVLTLVQPPKSAGDAKDELTSMRQIKGSSMFEESIDTLISVFRPGFDSSNDSKDDKYMVMPVLKNRMGNLFTLKFKWDGKTGSISEANYDDQDAIDDLISKNREKKAKPADGWG